jgi:hypothetical protein
MVIASTSPLSGDGGGVTAAIVAAAADGLQMFCRSNYSTARLIIRINDEPIERKRKPRGRLNIRQLCAQQIAQHPWPAHRDYSLATFF